MEIKNITFKKFKTDLERIVASGGEPEYPFLLNGKKYMIIGFKDFVTFQRFGAKTEEQSKEVFF